ncbi:MAG: hypothetical protein DRH24_08245 [Deltaproteobacteria bacterium]|nr:MAG: hypothetical protein DRH24_08245 [Deltaproteobacteria bacterium]
MAGSKDIDKEKGRVILIDWKTIWKPLSVIVGGFLIFFWLPVENSRFTNAAVPSRLAALLVG